MRKLTREQFIENSNIIHGDKYCYDKVNYISSNKKVIIICPKHGEFKQEANSHLRGSGCPVCSGNSKLNSDIFTERSNLIHNNKYDYSLVEYKNAFSKVIIMCKYHGEFKQTPNNHLNNHGCPLCGIDEISRKNSNDVQDFILNSKEKHGDKYDYSLVKYKNRKTNVIIICKIHGEFKKIPSNHINGQGCPKCSMYNSRLKKTKTKNVLTSDAIKIHGDKYDYSLVEYIGTDKKVRIICKKHGIFEQKFYKHIQGQGCPTCSSSKLEKEVSEFLNRNNIKYMQQYGRKNDSFYLNGQLLDFYLPEFKCAIECQGDQHFKPVDFGNKGEKFAYEKYMKIISNDLLKYSKCKENGVNILYYCGNKSYYDDYEYIDFVYDNLEKLILNL
jgi:Zn finger protein HypA/HybF involved in hydrogenase expression